MVLANIEIFSFEWFCDAVGGHCVLQLFIVFENLLFDTQWVEYVIRTKVVWMIPIWHLQIWTKIWFRKRDFGRWTVRPRLTNFDGDSFCFFDNSVFAFCIVFEWLTKCDAFAGKWNSEFQEPGRAQIEILMNYRMNPESEKVNIWKDLYQKQLIFKGGPQVGRDPKRFACPDQGGGLLKRKAVRTG